MCLAMVVAVMLAGCEKNQADQKKDSVQKSSQSTEPTNNGNTRDANREKVVKEEKDKKPVKSRKAVEKHIPLDGSWGEVLQVYQFKGKTKMLTLDKKNKLRLRNVSEGREYRYKFDFGAGSNVNSCKVLSCGSEIILHVNIHKRKVVDQDSSQGGMMISATDLRDEDRLYVFDQNLKIKKKDKLSGVGESLTAIVLDGGKGFAATDDGDIFHYSLKSGKGKSLGKKIQKQLRDTTIWTMYLNEKENRIAFLGQVINQDKKNVYGWIDLKDNSVEIKDTENSYGNNLHMEGDTAYITDGGIPRTDMATGVVKCMDLSAGNFFDFKVDNLESTKSSLAEDGSSLLACGDVSSEDRDRIVGYTLRMYDFPSGRVLYEDRWEDGGEVFQIFSCGKGFYAVKEKELHYIELQ